MPEKMNEAELLTPLLTQEEHVDAVNEAFDAVRESEATNEISELQEYIFELKAGLELDDKIGRMQKIQALMSSVTSLIELFNTEIERLSAEADLHVTEKEIEEEKNIAIYRAIHFGGSKDETLQDALNDSLAIISQHSQAISRANSQRVIYQADRIKYDAYKEALELPYSIASEYAKRLGVIAIEQAAIDQLPDVIAIPAPPEMKTKDQMSGSIDSLTSSDTQESVVLGGFDLSELELLMQTNGATVGGYTSPKTSYVHIAVKAPEPIPPPEPEINVKTETRTLPEILATTSRLKLSINARLLSGKEIAHRLTAK